MKLFKTISTLREFRRELSGSVALVPTMGNLHEGHLDLVKTALQNADHVFVSIFVNPIQFGPGEDLDSYPRTLEADCEKLEALGVTGVFAPNANEMYPNGVQSVRVVPSSIQNELCGASREGHFNGVTTVVSKLFNIVQPDKACFGEKDYQQLHIIREMVTELNMPIEIIAVPIRREASGLALSSRNGYLSDAEKSKALELSQTLKALSDAIDHQDNPNLRSLENNAIETLNKQGWKVDYISIRDQKTLAVANSKETPIIILAAARIGTTRLLDNMKVN